MSRTTCKLIGEDIVYKHVHVYTRDLSVNRLLMRSAVLRIYDYGICMRRRDHNKCVLPHLFSGPWMVDARGGGGRNISGLRTCTDAHLRMRH